MAQAFYQAFIFAEISIFLNWTNIESKDIQTGKGGRGSMYIEKQPKFEFHYFIMAEANQL